MKNYKGLLQTGVFFAPIIPQLGFVLLLIHLWLKREDFFHCFKQDIQNKINLIVLGILSLLALFSAIFSIATISHSIGYILYIVIIILGFYSVRLSSLPFTGLLKPFLYAISIDTVFGLFQWLFHIEIIKQVGPLFINIFYHADGRIPSLTGHPMVLAGLSTFAFLAGLILFIYYKSNIRYLYLILAVIAFLVNILTQSRANLLAMIIGIALILFLYYRKNIVVNIITILSVIIVAFLFSEYHSLLIPEKTTTSTFDKFSDPTGSGRTFLWQDSVTLIKNKPIFGYGPNSWQLAMKNMVGEKYGDISDAHNTFLRLAVDFGLPFASIFILFVLYRLAIRFMNSIEKDILTIGTAVSILTIMFLGIIDNPLSSINMTAILVVFAGLFWSFNKPPSEKEQP